MELSIISEKLEDIRNYLDVELHPVVSPDRWDVYSELRDMVDDIIALLKAQEPVEPTEPDEDNMRYCGACGSPVGYEVLEAPGIEYVQYSYCPFCGRAVKWE